MHIHFVCRGNLYRGRLAEAYLRSKQIPGLTVTSSGTEANLHRDTVGPLSWEALRLIKNNKLIAFMKLLPEQTTEQTLAQADIVIFFGQAIYETARSSFPHVKLTYHIWEIPDISIPNYQPTIAYDTKRMEISEQTFARIRQNVDALVENILYDYEKCLLHSPEKVE